MQRRQLGLFVLRNGVGVPSLIKSIQRGTITIPGNSAGAGAGITGVNTNHAVINFLGCTVAGVEDPSQAFARVTLTDATNVNAFKVGTAGGADDVVVSYEVIEYVPGVIRSIQRGTITAAAGTATASITGVNIEKSEVNYLGCVTANTGTDNTWLPRLDLQNATTVRATATAADAIVGFQVVEWN